MTKEKQISFIINNQLNTKDSKAKYLELLHLRIEENRKSLNTILTIMLITAFAFPLIIETKISEISIGPFKLQDNTFAISIIPSIFSFCYYKYALIWIELNEQNIIYKLLTSKLLSIENESYLNERLKPFSITKSVVYNHILVKSRKMGCVLALFWFPTFIGLLIFPFLFEYYSIKVLYVKYGLVNLIDWLFFLTPIFTGILTLLALFQGGQKNVEIISKESNGVTGGVTTSVYANDLYNSTASTSASLPYVTFSLVTPIAISGATINSSGLITVPAGTAPGTYTLTYRLSTVGNCNVTDIATVTILVTSNTTPPLVAGIRANNAVNHVELQSTNKSIISGYFTTYNNLAAPRIARLNTDLTLDLTFVSSGPNPSNYPPMDLIVQPDDKVIVAGGFSGFSGGSNGFGIARLLANGAIDTAYNVGGAGTAGNVGYTNNTPYALAQQSDGKILLGGDFYYYNGTQRLGIVRINTNGSVDTSFVPTELNSYYRSVVTGITLQPDGKMILLGFFSPPVAGATQKNILRLNANGTLDTTFSAGDTAGSLVYNVDLSVSLYSPIAKAVVQPDGKIIIAGAFNKYNGNNVKCLVRLTSTGAIDSSFNTTTGVERAINELILEPSTNKPLIGGEFTTFGTTPVKKLIRLTTTGALDTSFNIGTGTTDSVVYAGCPYCSNYVKVLKQQPDGKIIVGGKFTTFNGLSATNITRIFGAAGAQAKSIYTEYQSEPEIDINTGDAIAFYPNPSDGIYYFNLIDESNDTSLHVFNLVGEKVFSTVLSANQENEVNLSHLAKGCYLVKLSNATSTSTQKLIKN